MFLAYSATVLCFLFLTFEDVLQHVFDFADVFLQFGASAEQCLQPALAAALVGLK
jgi:hypothetical protein